MKKLTASDAQANDDFGVTVAVSGDTALVGAYTEAAGGWQAGAAYVFGRDEGGAGNWGEVKKLTCPCTCAAHALDCLSLAARAPPSPRLRRGEGPA